MPPRELGTFHGLHPTVVYPIRAWLDGKAHTWRLREVEAEYSATMADEVYAEYLSAGGSVTGGGGLRVRLVEEWEETPSGETLNVRRKIEKVLEVLPRAKTGQIPFPGHPAE